MRPAKQHPRMPPIENENMVIELRLSAPLTGSSLDDCTTSASDIASQIVMHTWVTKTQLVMNTLPNLMENIIRSTRDAMNTAHEAIR